MSLGRRASALLVVAATTAGFGVVKLSAQSPSGQGNPSPNFSLPAGGFNQYQAASIPAARPITSNGTVVEDVIARINDQVITRTEYERAQQGLLQEAKQENWPATELADKQHNLLRDMVDQQLLLSRGKELGINGDAEVTRQLDDMRKRANLPDMEALEKAAAQQGISYEDFKQNIRNQVITQQVVRDEVGRRLNLTHGQEQAYFEKHEKDFEQPEQVHLSEILVTTPESATDAQITDAQAKANAAEAKLKSGSSFAEVAKTASGGPTASAGGDLGDFKRGMLGDVLEKATFDLPVGGFTEPIRTRQGFVILKVDSHQKAGAPALADVENQVQEALYLSLLQPALRTYLTQARQDAYMETKPGFVDTGANGSAGRTTFTAYAPPPIKKKVIKKQRAEQEKAEKAERALAAAREKVALKQEAKAAQGGTPAGGAHNVSFRPKKIKREKVRYGQAPRNALPNGTLESTQAVPSLGAASNTGADAADATAPGAALAATDTASITTGGGSTDEPNPLEEQNQTTERKTRFSSRQSETEVNRAEKDLAKAEVKATKRPEKATVAETADEKLQSAPLGLQGPTQGKKQKAPKRPKGESKERLQDKPVAPPPAEPAIAPTVNPALGSSVSSDPTRPASGTTDQTTLPPENAAPVNAPPQGQPIPAVTGTQSNAPTTTVPQPQ